MAAGPSQDERRVTLEAGELHELAQAAREGGGDQVPPDDFDRQSAAASGHSKTRAGGKPPVSERTKARIRKLAREGMSRNAIARECKVSNTTVTRVCSAARPPITFDRAQTAAATEARATDMKAERARISQRAVDEVHRLLDLLVAPHEVIHWDKDGFVHRAEIERPTSGDVKNYATAIGILTDKHLALVKHDSDDRDLPAVDKWLAHVLTGAVAG